MKHKRIFFLLSALLLLVFSLLTGCGQNKTSSEGYAVVDAKGERVQLPSKPMRIVSLSLGTDELLMELVGTERLLAVTYLADDPNISHVSEESKKIKNKIKGNSAEAILALQPDLVIIADWWDLNIINTLRDMKVPVYRYKTPYSLAEVRSTIRELAAVVGEKERGKVMVAEFNQKIAAVEKITAAIPADKRKSAATVTSRGAFGGKGGIYDDMCQYAHINNVVGQAANQGMDALLSKEELVRLNPDVMLIATWGEPADKASTAVEELMGDASFQTVAAVQNKAVREISGSCVYCVSQYSADSLGILATAVYPEYFTN